MEQVKLLQQYIETLEKENQAKNRQRQTLYDSIAELQEEVDHLKDQNKSMKRLNGELRVENQQILEHLNQISLDHREITFCLKQKSEQLKQTIQDLNQLSEKHQSLIFQYEEAKKDMAIQLPKSHNKSINMEDIGIMADEEKSQIYEQVEGQSYRILQEALHDETEMNESLKETIDKQLQRIGELEYYRQNDRTNIANLQQLIKEYEKTESNLRQQIEEIKEEYYYLQAQMQENCQYNPQKIKELIENYEKIEELSSEQSQENENLKHQISNLRNYIMNLQKKIQYFQEGGIMDFSGSRRQNHNKSLNSNTKFFHTSLDHPPVVEVVRQNNKLIQKLTELEREKNQLYLERSCGQINQHRTDRSSASPLKNNNKAANSNQLTVSKLKFRIQALRQENENLLQALKVE